MPKLLTQITLFTMGKANLEKRILKARTETPDADIIVQYLVAVLIRQCLCVSDFAGICNDLIREIFLFAEPTDVMRKFCPLFRHAFKSGKEWDQVLKRLYKNTKQYHRYNNRLGESKRYLREKTTPVEALEGQQYKIVSTFEDAIGKVHTWSLRDADPKSSAIKIDSVLELMSTLTIFEKDDVRRFVKVVNSEIDNCTRDIKIRNGEIMENTDPVDEGQPGTGMSPEADLDVLSEEEKLELVKYLLPEGIVLTDTRMEELMDDVSVKKVSSTSTPEQSIAATAPKAESTSGSTASAVKEPPKTEAKKPAAQKPMALSAAKKRPHVNYQKPKSKKQKQVESQAELFKKTPEGKRASRKRKKK